MGIGIGIGIAFLGPARETCFLFRAKTVGHAGQPSAKLVLCWGLASRLYCILNNLGE